MKNATILVVEDNSIVGKDIQKRLTGMGYNVPTVVSTGDRALQTAEDERPDLVLMDIMLKGNLDGMETAHEITSRHNIPIVYLTAYSDESTLQKAKQTGAFGYLLKPFNETELHTTIEVALYKHKLERKLRESEQWLMTTINSITDIVVTTDTEGNIISMNRVAEATLGGDQKAFEGKPAHSLLSLVDENTQKPLDNFLDRILGNPIPRPSYALLQINNGRRIPVEDRSTKLRDPEGNVLGAVLVFQDITERRKAEQEIRRLNAELQTRVNELTALNKELSTFNYSVSHDLRSPLIAIDGFARVLTEERTMTSPDGLKHVSIIQKNVRLMLHTIDDLMLFSRLSRSQLEKEVIDMKSEGKTVFEELLAASHAGQTELKLATLPQAYADRAMIGQVLSSLFENAIKFTRSVARPLIEFGGEIDGLNCVYYVRDNGIGFDMLDVHHLFEVFQRLHSSEQFEGSGIGLAITHRIIERHGGRVWAESLPNKGATFYFSLPRKDL